MIRARTLLQSRAGLMALAVTLGLGNALMVMGWNVINPSNIAWIFGDNAAYHLGWAFYRHESQWTFPLTWTDRIGYPAGESIAFSDSIPLIPLLLRPVASLLPEPFQYLGLFACANFVLQAYFAFRLCARLFPRDPSFAVLGGTFFLLSPPMTWQLFGHYSHLPHWLLLAALDGYFRDPSGLTPVRWLSRHWIVLSLATGLNGYLAAMCLLITLAGLLRLRLERRCSWRMTGFFLALTLAVLGASLVLFGLIVPDSSSYRAPGYGRLSLNLLAPINPMVFGSILLPELPVVDPGQFEGYNYLGLGVIALLVLALVRRPQSFLWLREPRLLALVALTLVCTAAAASSTVTLGSLTLFKFDVPEPFAAITDSLRISGPLFWPAYYLLIAAALSVTFHVWKPPYRGAILAAALAIQFADVSPLRSKVHEVALKLGPDPLHSPKWQQLGRKYENLMVVPAFQCSPGPSPAGGTSFEVFGKLAAAQRMRTNSYYAARYTERQMNVHCVDVPRAVLTGTLDSRSAYVVTDEVRTILELSGQTSHRCEVVDGFNLCTPASAADSPAAWAMPAVASYAFGEDVDFTPAGNAREYMGYGWATAPLENGMWTVGPVATLLLGLRTQVDPAATVVLSADVIGFVFAAHRRIDADVVINGHTVDRWTFRHGRLDRKKSVRIPGAMVAGRSLVVVQFRILNPQAPAYVHGGYDVRFVGLNFHRLVLHREP